MKEEGKSSEVVSTAAPFDCVFLREQRRSIGTGLN